MSVTRIVVDALQVPRELSGVGRQAQLLGSELRDLPDEVVLEVRCPADVRGALEPCFASGTRFVTPVPRSRPRLRRLLHQQLLGPLRDGRETLVVCLGDQGPLWGKARTLVVVNDVRRFVDRGSSRAETLYYRAIVPRAVRHATSVATISQFSRSEIERVLHVDAVVLAHHPRPAARSGVTRRPHGTLLVVGALRPYKDVDTVVRALAHLQPAERRTVVLAGSDEGRRDELWRLARNLGVEQHLRIEGWVDEERLSELRAEAFATVNPSRYEGYGLPVAESLAHGLPTIASDIPPHREVAGDSALYFPPGDHAALAEQLRALDSDDVHDSLSTAALARSHELTAARPGWREVVLAAAGL